MPQELKREIILLLASLWRNPFVRLILIIAIIANISSFFAHKSEDAYHKDMQWEKPPDRLPDLVDATIQMNNRDAQMEQAIRQYDKIVNNDFPTMIPQDPQAFIKQIFLLFKKLLEEN